MQKYKVYINNKCKIITENWKDFSSRYTLIDAAGGVVYNSSNQFIMIYRNCVWDLPKGKIEIGENIRECAIREVEEECGITNLCIIESLIITYHVYQINNQEILKRTFWFKMHTNDNKLFPQRSEGITKAMWINKNELSRKLKNSYGNIKDILLNE